MKFAWVVIALAATLVGIGAACGPEQKYCYDQHKTCAQAALDISQAEKDRLAREMMLADAGTNPGDSAIVIGADM